jgi:hypothetical protein
MSRAIEVARNIEVLHNYVDAFNGEKLTQNAHTLIA